MAQSLSDSMAATGFKKGGRRTTSDFKRRTGDSFNPMGDQSPTPQGMQMVMGADGKMTPSPIGGTPSPINIVPGGGAMSPTGG